MNFLQPNSVIEIIAPGSLKSHSALQACQNMLESWNLIPRAPADIFGPDLLYTNTNSKRLEFLKQAIEAPDSEIIWCFRGGCGSTRLIPELQKLSPFPSKIFIGFSDITALHLFFYQNWSWQNCIHGPALKHIGLKEIDENSIQAIKQLLFQGHYSYELSLESLNQSHTLTIEGPMTGGNFSLLQASIGTAWQLRAADHILIIEDTDEKPYRTAERLEHLRQAGLFKDIKALVFADFNFLTPVEPRHHEIYLPMLQQFSEEVDFPVFKTTGIGHTKTNYPFILGKKATISKNYLQLDLNLTRT